MTAGEPSQGRRLGGVLAGLVCTALAVASLAFVTQAPPAGPVLIEDLRIGYRLEVPAGWRKLTAPQLAPYLPLSSDDLDNKYVGFGSGAGRTFGLLTVRNVDTLDLVPACQDQLRRVGGVNEAQPLGYGAPQPFGKDSMMFELRTATGATGRLACAKRGKRFITLAVLVTEPTPGIGAAAFERVCAGLTLN